jgi:hypothetical protein
VGEDGVVVVPQRPAQQQHLGRDVEQVLPPHHVCDAHGDVVHGVGHQEHGGAVGPQDHEVLEIGVGEGHVTADEVGERRDPLVGRAEAHHDARTGRHAPVAAVAVVAGLAPAGLSPGVDLLTGAVAAVGETRFEQPGDGADVLVGAARLVLGLAVPVDAEPVERPEDEVDQFRLRALGIGVLDAQQHLPARVAGQQPVEQRRARRPHVEVARRGRGESGTDRCRHPGDATGPPRRGPSSGPGRSGGRRARLSPIQAIRPPPFG